MTSIATGYVMWENMLFQKVNDSVNLTKINKYCSFEQQCILH